MAPDVRHMTDRQRRWWFAQSDDNDRSHAPQTRPHDRRRYLTESQRRQIAVRRTYDLGRMHGWAFVGGKKIEYQPQETFEYHYEAGFKDGVTEAKEWRKGVGGIAEELGEIARKVWDALTTMPDIPDVLRLPTLPTISGGVKQTRPSSKGDLKRYSREELAKRLNTTTEDLHRNIKQVMKKKFHDELKKIGSPDNPDILVDRAGNVWLLNLKTRKAINTGRSLDIFKK